MIIKCKMCGGDIAFNPGDTYGTCEYCGSTSTIPQAEDENKLNRYNRANHFRRQCEFDKAVAAYEKLLEQDDTDAEAHWGAVISRYGIEYVEDPASKKRVPTCHRVQVAGILADADYLAALENAPDAASRDLYKQQAAEIAEIQKGILAISANEKPYDVFICYKETDENGQRTHDSQWAQDVYYGLTEQGYKVFFSRITLEDKLGQQYEPYIFAALNSAKVMVVIGSRPEYFNAVWVKNEWSRYLALMAKDRKRLLIPCYRDMDPYDLPEELSSLQSQDMSKIGFMQDLLRGIKKVLDAEKKPEQPKVIQQTVQAAVSDAGAPGVVSLMKRVKLFMEDGDFKSASEYIDRVLDIDPECSAAYAAKVCVAFELHREAELADTTFLYEDNADWQKALRFADAGQKAVYEGYIARVKERVAAQIRDYAYNCAVEMAVNPGADHRQLANELTAYRACCTRSARYHADGSRREKASENEVAFERAVKSNEPGSISEQGYKDAAEMFRGIRDEKADARAKQCLALAEQARQKLIYSNAVTAHSYYSNNPTGLEDTAKAFLSVSGYKDAKEQAQKCVDEAENIRDSLYTNAVNAMKAAGDSSSKWDEAKKKLAEHELNNYRDVAQLLTQAAKRYDECLAAEKEAQRQKEEKARREAEAAAAKKKRNTIMGILAAVIAVAVLLVVTKVIIPGNKYKQAEQLRADGKYEEAVTVFAALDGYRDAAAQITETKYQHAQALNAQKDYAGASAIFITIKGYKDVDKLLVNDENISAAAARRAEFTTVGKTFTFGHYEQDNNTGNGKEAIEWQVLEVKGDKVLIISKNTLDAKAYHSSWVDITWEKCTLRTWLNKDFLNVAFSAAEQAGIETTTVDNSKAQGYSGYSTNGGNNTQDKIFLLSYAEAWKYFGSDSARVSTPTKYAKANEGSSYSDMWWLRSPGFLQNYAALVRSGGSHNYNHVNDTRGVRPALWVNLESGIFKSYISTGSWQ